MPSSAETFPSTDGLLSDTLLIWPLFAAPMQGAKVPKDDASLRAQKASPEPSFAAASPHSSIGLRKSCTAV